MNCGVHSCHGVVIKGAVKIWQGLDVNGVVQIITVEGVFQVVKG